MKAMSNPTERIGSSAEADVAAVPLSRTASNACATIAVCVLGPCADLGLLHQTVEGIVDQDYEGAVIAIVPNVVTLDRQWTRRTVGESRSIIVSRTSAELNCNSAFALALDLQPEVQFVALINCGERPPRKWLHSLKEVQEEFDADVVTGPVKAMFDEPPSDWVLASGYFDRCGIRFGPIPRLPGLDNSLIRSEIIRSCSPEIIPFHLPEADGIDFAYQLKMAGSVAVWASEAIVFNSIPKCRMSDEWLLESDFLRSYAVARVQSRYRANSLADVFRRVRACGLLLAGIAAYSVGPRGSLRARLMLARARGALAGSISNRS